MLWVSVARAVRVALDVEVDGLADRHIHAEGDADSLRWMGHPIVVLSLSKLGSSDCAKLWWSVVRRWRPAH